jgi:hypothetical protein
MAKRYMVTDRSYTSNQYDRQRTVAASPQPWRAEGGACGAQCISIWATIHYWIADDTDVSGMPTLRKVHACAARSRAY